MMYHKPYLLDSPATLKLRYQILSGGKIESTQYALDLTLLIWS